MKPNVYSHVKVVLLAFLVLTSFSIQKLHAQQFLTTIDGWNAYVHLPDEYNDSVSKRYPVIIFFPGIGEFGTNPSKLLVNGPSKFISDGHNMQFIVNGKLEKPIVISLQPRDPWPPMAVLVNRRIDSIVKRWRCDERRINGTGLSAGASTWGTYVSAGQPVMTNRLASMVVMSGGVPETGISTIKDYVINGGKWWGLEGSTDPLQMDMLRDTINFYKAASARYYRYTGGHCCWNTWYDPNWNENGESIYTWMLKQVRPAGANSNPESNAGRDSILASVVTTFNLKGNGNDPDGNPISFNWRKLSGPAGGTITTPTAAQSTVSGLSMGIYNFELTVTDVLGATSKDTVVINDGAALLPLTLLDFNASEKVNHVLLQWNTESELNTSHFEVQKLDRNQVYAKAGGISAKGASSLINHYQFLDQAVEAGIVYYRLKMVDKDGQFTYSKVIAVNVKNTTIGSLSLISLKSQGAILNYNISSSSNKPATITLSDMQGKLVYRRTIQLTKGVNSLNQNINLQKAVYVLTVATGEAKLSQAFTKE